MTVPAPIAKVLRSDEKLIWFGQPRTGTIFVLGDWLLVPPAIAILAFAAFLMLRNQLIACVMLLTALVVVVLLRFQLDRMRRKNIWYLVTDKRIVVINNSIWDRTVRSKQYSPDFVVTPVVGPKGSTTIYFGRETPLSDFLFPANYYSVMRPPAFMFIDNDEPVIDLVRHANRNAIAKE